MVPHQADWVCVFIFPYILPQLSTWDPFRDELKGIQRDTFESHNVLVIQKFPHDSFLAEQLQNSLGIAIRPKDSGEVLLWRHPDRSLSILGVF